MSACHHCGAELAPGANFCSACGTSASGAHHPKRAAVFNYVPHPHIENRKQKAPKAAPVRTEPLGALARFNAWLAVKITGAVGTMWCAYVFAAIALISLPDAIKGGTPTLVAWIAQTFLQLVLLSIIIVGQKVESAASETRAIDTYKDAEAILGEAIQIQKHLEAQDTLLGDMIKHLQARTEPGQTEPQA